MKNRIFGVGHGLAAIAAFFFGHELFHETGQITSLFAFYAVTLVMSGLSAFVLLVAPEKMKQFVRTWNWVLLAASLLAVWLGTTPALRAHNLWFLGFSALACAFY